MDTGTKVLVGTGVLVAGFLVYRAVSKPTAVQTAARPAQSSTTNVAKGFLDFGTSVFNYFATKNTPTPAYTPGVHGTGGIWDATKDNSLPLLPGQTMYADSTTHDDLLA